MGNKRPAQSRTLMLTDDSGKASVTGGNPGETRTTAADCFVDIRGNDAAAESLVSVHVHGHQHRFEPVPVEPTQPVTKQGAVEVRVRRIGRRRQRCNYERLIPPE